MFFSYCRVTDLMHLINIVLDKIEIMHVDVMIDNFNIMFYFQTKKEQSLFPLCKVN